MASPAQDTLSMDELASKYAIAASVLQQDPSLVAALNKILGIDPVTGKKVSGIITDPALQLSILQESDWFKNNSDDWRKFQTAKIKNPATFEADLLTNTENIMRQYKTAGVQITEADARKLAEQVMMKSAKVDGKMVLYNQSYINKTLAGAIDFTKKKTINGRTIYDMSGALEDSAQKLYQKAYDYGFESTLSNKAFTSWFEKNLKGIVSGEIQDQDVDDELQKQAMSMFPGLTSQISRGQTLREAADPWLKAISDTWEVDPSQLDLKEDTVYKVLNFQDEKGNIAPMNLYDAKKTARRHKNFDFTQTAKEEKTDIANRILKDFGFLG